MFGQNTCIGEKLKDLKAQLDHELGDHFNLNNYMDEMNSEIISKLQMPCPIRTWLALKTEHVACFE